MSNPAKIVRAVEDFPTLPTIYSALLDMLSNTDSKVSDVANLISKDQATVLKILKTANSAFYGFNKEIDNITSAITLLGFYEIKNIVMSLTFINLFKQTKLNQYINPVDYWKHSIGVAIISRRLGISLNAHVTENYFLAGLLHDIGKLVCYLYFTTEYGKALQYCKSHRVSMLDAETRVLGFTHQDIGEEIAIKWNLPHDIRNAIKHHHTGIVPQKFEPQTAAVHISNIAVKILNLGNSGNTIIERPNPNVWKHLGLSENTFVNNFIPIVNDYNSSLKLFMMG